MRLFSWLLIFSMATLVQIEAFAAKPAPPPPPPPPSGTACANSSWAFPAMAYSRGVYSKSGAYQKTQIFVADSHGTCEVMVYDTGDYAGKPVFVSFHYDAVSGIGTLVWKQDVDNGRLPVPGRVVKLARFEVAADGTVLGLPISATTIYRLPATLNFSIPDVELSQDGERVAFTEHYRVTDTGPWTLQVKVCDVPAAPAVPACQNIQTALSVSAPSIGGSHQLTIGRNESLERIYLLYRASAAANVADLWAIDNQGGGSWTSGKILDQEDMATEGDPDIWLDTLDALSLPGGDRVLISSSPDWPLTPRVAIYDAAQGTVNLNAGSGYHPTWTLNPSIDTEAPNVLVTQMINFATSPVREIDLDGQASETLPIMGYGVDGAD